MSVSLRPGERLKAAACSARRRRGAEADSGGRSLVAVHVRSEGKHEGGVGDSPLWSEALAAAVACARAAEARTRAALAALARKAPCSGPGPPSSPAYCAEVGELAAARGRWAVLADRSDLLARLAALEPARVAALSDDSVRVHSGLKGARKV